jgi:hypothetical protein
MMPLLVILLMTVVPVLVFNLIVHGSSRPRNPGAAPIFPGGEGGDTRGGLGGGCDDPGGTCDGDGGGGGGDNGG